MSWLHRHSDALRRAVELFPELSIVVADQKLGSLTPRRCVPELLCDPRTRWGARCADMDDLPRADLQDHKRDDGLEEQGVASAAASQAAAEWISPLVLAPRDYPACRNQGARLVFPGARQFPQGPHPADAWATRRHPRGDVGHRRPLLRRPGKLLCKREPVRLHLLVPGSRLLPGNRAATVSGRPQGRGAARGAEEVRASWLATLSLVLATRLSLLAISRIASPSVSRVIEVSVHWYLDGQARVGPFLEAALAAPVASRRVEVAV
jgi:hypothetical protein